MEIDIRQATEEDIPALYALYEQIGKQDDGYFEACFEKDCLILIASIPPHPDPLPVGEREEARSAEGEGGVTLINIGFGVLNFEPKYNLYQRLSIPEIQDLNVIPEARQQGVATAIIEALENIARDQGAERIGISVGLTKDYGPAQRLYVKLGYIPDGYGITYDREAVTSGASYPIDNDLALMLVKVFEADS